MKRILEEEFREFVQNYSKLRFTLHKSGLVTEVATLTKTALVIFLKIAAQFWFQDGLIDH